MRPSVIQRFIPLGFAVAALAAMQSIAAQTLINGAGATFPAPIYTKWFNEFHKLHGNIQINYQPLGSGAGIRQVTEGTIDFGASDSPMTEAQSAQYKKQHGFGILHFPTVAGADVPTYNLPGVSSGLNFTAHALAGIFLGKITKWNDPELTKANPHAKLPDADIIVVHRSEGSGTTYCWTDFLSKVSSEWKSKVGPAAASVNWPVGLGAKGNDGVAGQLRNLANSIGYVELIYAIQNKIPYGNVQGPSGAFVKPSFASITAAAADASMPADFRVSIVNSPGQNAYPISTFTWLLIPEQIKDRTKLNAIKDFLAWMLSSGQNMAESLSYARLPNQVIVKEQKQIDKIK